MNIGIKKIVLICGLTLSTSLLFSQVAPKRPDSKNYSREP